MIMVNLYHFKIAYMRGTVKCKRLLVFIRCDTNGNIVLKGVIAASFCYTFNYSFFYSRLDYI